MRLTLGWLDKVCLTDKLSNASFCLNPYLFCLRPYLQPPKVVGIKSELSPFFMQVSFSKESVMSSCVKPKQLADTSPIVLLHGFDRLRSCKADMITFFRGISLWICAFAVYHFLFFSSCLEWRYTLPLLEEGGFETWAVDILGWGFSDLGWFHPLRFFRISYRVIKFLQSI